MKSDFGIGIDGDQYSANKLLTDRPTHSFSVMLAHIQSHSNSSNSLIFSIFCEESTLREKCPKIRRFFWSIDFDSVINFQKDHLQLYMNWVLRNTCFIYHQPMRNTRQYLGHVQISKPSIKLPEQLIFQNILFIFFFFSTFFIVVSISAVNREETILLNMVRKFCRQNVSITTHPPTGRNVSNQDYEFHILGFSASFNFQIFSIMLQIVEEKV